MSFIQNYYGSIGNVVNAAGGVQIDGRVVLGKDSGSHDLVRELGMLRQQIATTPQLSDAMRQKAMGGIDAAVQEANSTKPKGDAIKSHLDGAAETLKSVTSTASNALGLVKVLVAFGQWAASLFVL